MTENNGAKQNLELYDRKLLNLTGVVEVINFDETKIVLETNLGSLVILGEELHINQLDLDSSKLSVDGYIRELKYDQELHKGGIIKRLFK
ncbi:sporulation protein YabP [Natroniella sulfidigena]|uniref:sporulation protein YabP n=1 Tax=Natroniella sulfidigena TaxID=723921 RepID=UPI00200A4C7B|nr:sporulation protein YabP [Natroniella sulfidigena]MCK8817007.1 sporulation protein YabP [Natroniella sulfidigena]